MSADRPATTRYVEQVMGLPFSLALRGRHRDDIQAARAWQAVLEDLRAADRVFSTYREDSWVSRVNRDETGIDGGPPEAAQVMGLAAQAARDSGGAFSVWLPRADGTIALDPSGVVKGWVTQRASRHLADLPGTSFSLSAGGDVLCGTDADDPDGWRIAVADPFDATRVVATVEVRDGAVATSGTSARGQHLLDGRTGQVATGLAQVTVVGPSLTWADIWATSAFALGAQAAGWLTGLPSTHAVLVHPDGRSEVLSAQARLAGTQCSKAVATAPGLTGLET